MKHLRLILYALAAISLIACRRSPEEAANRTNSGQNPPTDAKRPSKSSNSSRENGHSLLRELQAIDKLPLGPNEKSRKAKDYLSTIAKTKGVSLPVLIAENLSDLLPDPSDPQQLNRLSWLCFGERKEMVEFITTLPAGPLRSEAVNTYGGTWAADHNFDALKEAYELIAPGSDRTTLASLGSRAAYLSSEPAQALVWIKSLEYQEEKRIAINEVGSLFTQGLGTPADRAAFLSELQSIATANGVTPPSGKRGEPLPPLEHPPAPAAAAPNQ